MCVTMSDSKRISISQLKIKLERRIKYIQSCKEKYHNNDAIQESYCDGELNILDDILTCWLEDENLYVTD